MMRNFRPLIALGVIAAVLPACQRGENAADSVPAVAVPASLTLVESVGKSAADVIVLPYRKYRLANGLTIILHEDDSDPLVHVDMTYHVGSAREEVGKSGFAHFFEHMMFQGTEHAEDELHFRLVSEGGGTLNGSTSNDITNYFQTVPSNQLERVLWLEADRMGFLLDAVTQEKFEVQRETVKNERGQRVDNQPYGLLGERVNEAQYPEGHPYSWPVIGYIEDLDRVDVNDLKAFFLRWYGPNNATLTIGGQFDEAEVLAWVDKYFGPIPPGPAVAMPDKPDVVLDADRYISLEDEVALPLLYMSFPTVHLYHDDEAPLDVLMFILGQGETSLLYKNMVRNQLAVQASANHACLELSCTFTILALPNPAAGTSLADLERIGRESLEEFAERGVNDDDLERVKMTIVSGMIYGLESVAGKVGRLAMYQTYTGNPNFAADDIARYENVTEEDVMRVFQRYIKDRPAVIMSVVPRGQAAAVAHEDTWTRTARKLPDYAAIADADLPYRRAVDKFDRSVVPPAGENPAVTLPEIWRTRLDNGIEVLGAANTEVPTTAIQIRLEVGQRHEPLDKLGLATLTGAMLNEATTERSNEEISNELQKLGGSVEFGVGNDSTYLVLRSLTENLDAVLGIAAERLLKPKFDPEDFERVKAQTLQSIRQAGTQPGVVADVVYQLLLYGKDNSFSYLNMGTEESVARLTLDDVKAFYASHFSPRVAEAIAVSNLSRPELMQRLAVFSAWQGPEVATPPLAPFPDIDGTRIYLVDKPGAAQSEIRIGKRAMPFDATGEYFRAGVMNFALGGAFNSRINLNLREDKGYTYGAGSGFSATEEYGTFTAQAAVRSNATAASIAELEREIREYAESGIDETELVFTRRSIGQRDARSFETPRQKLGFLAQMVVYDLDNDFVERQKQILGEIGKSEIDRLAKEQLDLDDMIIVVVGDKQTVLPELAGLGYEIVELDAEGNPVE